MVVVQEALAGQGNYPPAISIRRALTVASTGPVRHQTLKLLYVNRGRTRILHDAGSITLPQGSLALLPADQWYTGEPSNPVETLTVYLDPEFVHSQIRWLPAAAIFLERILATAEPTALLVHPLQRISLKSHLNDLAGINPALPNGELLRHSRLASIIALLYNTIDFRHAVANEGHAAVEEAAHLLEGHLQSPWSIQELARAVSISPSQLTRLFVQQTGIAPSRFLRESRAYRMRELLKDKRLSVAEAAKAVGWNDPSHAARVFRTVFGHSPRQATSDRP